MAYYALVPAAGAGLRMANTTPKQYLQLAGHPVIWHALRALCAHPAITRVFVVLSAHDAHWSDEDMRSLGRRVQVLRCGGETRAQSVLNGLRAMGAWLSGVDERAAKDPSVAEHWVLVHDAARPCLSGPLIDRLISSVGDDAVGGILAVPVADTLKRASQASGMASDAVRIAATVPRDGLWQAQTPQMFRYGLLVDALQRAVAEPDSRIDPLNNHHDLAQAVTDEASAVEMLGHAPRLVASSAHNLKVTYPADLPLAASVLQYLFFSIPTEEQQ